MVDLQELITRGRMVMANAPGRLGVFKAVNGRANTAEIAKSLRRHKNSIRRDLSLLEDAELIRPRTLNGKPVTKNKLPVYEKVPLARTLKPAYFVGLNKIAKPSKPQKAKPSKKKKKYASLPPRAVPSDKELLYIVDEGEDQTNEFKASGTKTEKLVKEIAAMLNTKAGGIIFYGIEDDGKITGSDISNQDLDQRVQNGIRTTIKPRATVKVKKIKVMGSEVSAIIVPPWNGSDVYQLNDTFYIRHGGNSLPMSGEEIKKMLLGKPVS